MKSMLVALGICVAIAAVEVGGILLLSWFDWQEHLENEKKENEG